jgi:dipeptidyl-peptidase 4
MPTVRSHAVRCALLAAALTASSIAALAGCRGEPKAPPAPPPADEKLAWPALDDPGLVAWAATEGYALGTPRPLAIAPDGAVLFARARPRDPGADLYQLDAAGKTTVLATAATLLGATPVAEADRAGAARGITEIQLSASGARVLVPLAGRLFVIERATAAARELVVGAHRDPQLSPDGASIAFARDGDLWVASIGAPGGVPGAAPGAAAGGAPVAATATPVRIAQHPPDREYATPETAARAFGRDRGLWWSPDSQSIAFQRTDARAVETHYLADPRHPEQPPAAVKVALAGKPQAIVDLGIVSIHGGTPRWVTWDLVRYPYVAHVIWPAKGPLTVIAIGRDQTQLAVLAADAATGATRSLLIDKDPAWLDVPRDVLTWLDDGTGFLWMTGAHGAWSLERHAADGALGKQLVSADVGLRRVVGVSADGSQVIIEAAADPREQHVWLVPIAGGAPLALTTVAGGGVHRAWAGAGAVVIASAQRPGGQVTTVVRGDGSRTELPSVAEHPRAPATKLETAALDDHVQDVAITRPTAFDPKVRYPVVLRIDARPDAKSVRDALDTYVLDQWYADAGFIVVRTDGRGTPGHDRIWQHAITGDVLTLPMNDQIGALKQLGARYPELDLGRVAAVGSGPGGHLAALAVLLHPDVFAAAIAVSPITDWALLEAAYAERIMKNPATNPEGYRRTTAAAYAEQLRRPLLIVHALADDRIGLAHTLALIEALSAAGKRAELAILPASPELAIAIAGQKLALDFLRDRLGPPVRPAVMPRPRTEEEAEEDERERERGHAGSAQDRDKDRDKDQDNDKPRPDRRDGKDRGDKDRDDKDRR